MNYENHDRQTKQTFMGALQNSGLSIRIAIGVVSMVMVGGLVLMFVENARLRDIYLNEQRIGLERKQQAEKLRLIHITDTLRRDVLFLSNTPPVSGIMRAALNRDRDPRHGYSGKVWGERLQQIFSAFSAAHPEYYQIRYIGMADGGRELVRIDNRAWAIEVTPQAGLQARGDRDYFKAALKLRAGEVHLSEFGLNREWGAIEQPHRPTLRAVTPVFAPSGEMFGMVVINMDAGRLLASATLDVPDGVLAYMTNMSGEYLLHPDASRSFRFELGGKGNIAADFPFLKAIFDPREPEHLPLRAVETEAGYQYLAAERIHFDSGNPARFLALAYHLPGTVAARQAAAVPARYIAGGFAAMLLVSILALFVLRRMFAPLEQLTVAARKITVGDYDVRLPQGGSGEIVSLICAFNVMLDELSQREQKLLLASGALERRVSERTAELERARFALEMELQRKRLMVDVAMDGFWAASAEGVLLEVNEAYARMSGYTTQELVGMRISQLEANEREADVRAHIAKIIAQGHDRFETRHRRKDGQEIDIEVSVTYMAELRQFFAFCRDITERKQFEEARLQESEERFRGTLEQAAVGIAHTAMDGSFRQVNRKFCTITGYARDELLGMNDRDITFPGDLEESTRRYRQLFSDETAAFSMEKRYVRKDRSPVWVNLTVSALHDAGGAPKYTIGVIEDITERKRMERQLRDLTAHIQTVREEEKASIAREVHDDLGSTLTALKMDVYWLAGELSANKEAAPLFGHIESMSQLLDNMTTATRRIITDLRPTILDDLGLQAALEWQAEQFRKRTGIQCRVECSCRAASMSRLGKAQTINLFRIFQESLTNVARHSGASGVEAELLCEDEEVILTVSDNGRGLPEGHAIGKTSYGMLGMRERAEQMGGRINFYSPPGGGFSVTVVLPLSPPPI